MERDHFNFLVKAGVIVGSGGLIFGYDIGVIAGTLSQLKSRSFQLKFILFYLCALYIAL